MRIRNHIARDLASPKYRQKIVKRKNEDDEDDWKKEVDDYYNKKG